MKVDLLVTGGHVFTMRGEGVGYLEGGALAVERGRIQAVGRAPDMRREFQAEQVLHLEDHAILPGLIDAHMHLWYCLLRGLAQDTQHWMLHGIGPFMPYIGEREALAGTQLGAVEAVLAGTTTFGEYAVYLDGACEFFKKLGVRAQVTPVIREVPRAMAGFSPGDLYPFDPALGERALAEALRIFGRWHGGADGRISVLFGPQGPDFLSKELLLRVQALARARGTKVHLHTAQGDRETIQVLKRHGLRPVPYLDSIGLLDGSLLAVHLTDATDDEAALVARRGASMILCSGSIAIIDGIVPPSRAFRQAGGLVALGSDQSPGNNCHNMWNEMKLTALLNKVKGQDPTLYPAWEVLRMATCEAARAIGLGAEVGTLEAGKRADIIAVDLRRPGLAPVFMNPMRNIVPNLVYAARGHEVSHVIIDGKLVVEEGRLLTADVAQVVAEAQSVAREVGPQAAPDFWAVGGPNAAWMKEGRL